MTFWQRRFFALFVGFMLATSVHADIAPLGWTHLEWDYDPEEYELVEGFILYCNEQVAWTGKALSVDRQSIQVADDKWLQKCVVTAYAGPAESGQSNEVRFLEGSPAAPANPRFNTQQP